MGFAVCEKAVAAINVDKAAALERNIHRLCLRTATARERYHDSRSVRLLVTPFKTLGTTVAHAPKRAVFALSRNLALLIHADSGITN